jgi:hypothetical protein
MCAFFSERKIRRNILPVRLFGKIIRFARIPFIFLLFLPGLMAFTPQERSTNPRKAERIRAKKEKEARRKYEKDVRMHMNNQSKETKSMMKKAKKDSRKNSPVKPSSGKKCH